MFFHYIISLFNSLKIFEKHDVEIIDLFKLTFNLETLTVIILNFNN